LTVTLSRIAPEPVTVFLDNLTPNVATVQSSAVIPAGASSAPVTLKGITAGQTTVTASLSNSSASTPVLVTSVSSPTNVAGTGGQVQSGSQSQSQQNAKVALPFSYTSQLTMANDRCSGAKNGEFSSFVQRGRDRAPSQPGQFLTSPPSTEEESVQIGSVSFQLSTVGGRLNPLNLAPGVAAFINLGQKC
jgi:hypothetical protein